MYAAQESVCLCDRAGKALCDLHVIYYMENPYSECLVWQMDIVDIMFTIRAK